MRVALFITCLNDTLFPQTGRAVVTLLERLGCEVDFPEAHTCCGQMHVGLGYLSVGATFLNGNPSPDNRLTPALPTAVAIR